MKNLILGVLLTGVSVQTYAQQDALFQAKLKKEEVPAVVVEAVETDFPDFSVTDYAAVPVDIVDEDVYVDTNEDAAINYNTYQLNLSAGPNRSLNAIYDSNGELICTIERLKDVAPPTAVRNSIAAKFPGWTIEKDNYKMVHYTGKKARERYKLVLDQNNKKMRVYTDQNGKVLKVS